MIDALAKQSNIAVYYHVARLGHAVVRAILPTRPHGVIGNGLQRTTIAGRDDLRFAAAGSSDLSVAGGANGEHLTGRHVLAIPF